MGEPVTSGLWPSDETRHSLQQNNCSPYTEQRSRIGQLAIYGHEINAHDSLSSVRVDRIRSFFAIYQPNVQGNAAEHGQNDKSNLTMNKKTFY